MFKSFFPKPKLFFTSLVLWSIFCITVWYGFKTDFGEFFGFNMAKAEPVIGLGYFTTDPFLLFYIYYTVSVLIFALFWMQVAPHRWQIWSIFGSAVILFSTYYSVQVSVALNHWRKPFFDLIQKALTEPNTVPRSELYDLIIIFCQIAFIYMVLYAGSRFLISHFVFRWRSAMNDYYTDRWTELRHIEGASQRIQEDTMRFAQLMERLGVALVDSIMTLFAFLPLLLQLSVHVQDLPIVGAIPYPLFTAAIVWSIFGTGLLALVGIKLPGLEFKIQRVEAAYRKELVYGEDSEQRAQPLTLKELFRDVRTNYFRLYFHYLYFNISRGLFIQADNVFVLIILIPTVVLGKITLGIFYQIIAAFNQVSTSFQYLVNSWYEIVDLLSVYKRLITFEAQIGGKPLPKIDQEYQPGISDK